MWKLLPISLLLLSGCATTVSSVDVICSLNLPTFTQEEVDMLSEETTLKVDLFFEQYLTGCGGHRDAS